MPAPIKNIDFDEVLDPNDGFDDGTTPQEPDQDPGVGNGPGTGDNGNTGNNGGNSPKGPYGDTEDPEEPPKDTIADPILFIVKSNQTGFSTFVNNNKVGINSLVRISREQLAKEDKKITVSKQGYLSNEYYIVSMLDDGAPIIENQSLKPGSQLLGINTKAISLIKYVDNKIVEEKGVGSSTTVNLDFKLNQKPKGGPTGGDTEDPEEPNSYKVNFIITGEGLPVSILKNGNKNAQFFPSIGESTYEDVEGTNYVISSADITSDRITSIRILKPDNEPVLLEAGDGETLETTLTLSSGYSIIIDTEKIPVPTPGLDPQISLVNNDPRKYNINTKSGVPLMVQMNEDVQAITVVVGDDILEFDDFGRDTYEEPGGKIVGITIPHRVFNKIGQYKIKLFPFSFDDYESQVREDEEPITITPKETIPKFDEVETELPPPPPTKGNPYNPPISSTPSSTPSRGGGGGGREFIIEDDFSDDTQFGGGGRRNDDFSRPGNRNDILRQY